MRTNKPVHSYDVHSIRDIAARIHFDYTARFGHAGDTFHKNKRTYQLMNKNEIWKPVLNYEGLYEVSNLGRVKSLISVKILKPKKRNDGYLSVVLCENGKMKMFLVHRLVYSAFNGEIPPGLQVNHLNEDKSENRLDNLSLCTAKENTNWGTCIQRRAKKQSKPVIAFDKSGNFIQEFKSLTEAANWLGKKCMNNICSCLKGHTHSAYGYVWRYKN